MKPRNLFLLEVLLAIASAVILAVLASRNAELLGPVLAIWPPLR